jgi:hypothetical protein
VAPESDRLPRRGGRRRYVLRSNSPSPEESARGPLPSDLRMGRRKLEGAAADAHLTPTRSAGPTRVTRVGFWRRREAVCRLVPAFSLPGSRAVPCTHCSPGRTSSPWEDLGCDARIQRGGEEGRSGGDLQ